MMRDVDTHVRYMRSVSQTRVARGVHGTDCVLPRKEHRPDCSCITISDNKKDVRLISLFFALSKKARSGDEWLAQHGVFHPNPFEPLSFSSPPQLCQF